MQGNHLAYAATQGIVSHASLCYIVSHCYNNNNSRFSTGRLLAIEDFTFTYDERNLFLAQMCAAFYVKFINNVLPAKELEEPYAPFSLLSNQLMN